MKIIFFGTPLFAAKILTFLIENHIQVKAIVTKPDKAQERSGKPIYSAVKKLVLEQHFNIPLLEPEKASDPSFAKILSTYKADLFIVVAYGEIIKENLLQMPRLGCINIHPSLLPKYRGAAPMQFALLNGDKESGVTIMEMALKMDAGDIIKQKTVPIADDMNRKELEAELCKAACEILLEVIYNFKKGMIYKTPQNHDQATYVKKIDSSMAKINWSEPANVVHNCIRAFSPEPGAWCVIQIRGQVKRMKILRSHAKMEYLGLPGETIIYDKQHWIIACGKGALQLLEVQLEGKKRMSVVDFLKGHSVFPIIQK